MKKIRMTLYGFFSLLFVLMSLPVMAETYTVGHSPGNDFTTITAALISTGLQSGDTILVALGTYTASDENYPETFPLIINQEIEIRGMGAIGDQVIDSEGSGRIFSINVPGSGTVRLSGLKMSGGKTEKSGGAILCEGAILYIENCEITGNTANLYGGGIAGSSGAEIRLSDTTISKNSSEIGAGIFMSMDTSLTADRVNFFENTAEGNGAGVHLDRCRIAEFNHCVFGENSSNALGGAVFVSATPNSFKNCTIAYNKGVYGGGIYLSGMDLELVNSIVWGNLEDLHFSDPEATGIVIDHCNIGGGQGLGENSNISSMPGFSDPQQKDFSIRSDSTSIDRGKDIGFSYQGTAPDLGALESEYSGINELPTPETVSVGASGDFKTIPEALRVFNYPGCKIELASGNYEMDGESMPLVLYGVSLSGPEYSAQEPKAKIIGNGVDAVITAFCQDAFSLKWLSITQGGRSGIRLVNASPEIEKCLIKDNRNFHEMESGGGVSSIGGSPVITDCLVQENQAYYGGGLAFSGPGSPVISRCSISDNTAEESGGGFYCCDQSEVTLTSTTVASNTAHYGGGGYCKESMNFLMSNSEISDNVAESGGGGLVFKALSPYHLSKITFKGNSCDSSGGAIYSESPGDIFNCDFESNSAKKSGGGIAALSSGISISSCNFIANNAEDGGGMYTNSIPEICNSQFLRNTAKTTGGGLSVWIIGSESADLPIGTDPELTMFNCLFAQNQSNSEGGGIYWFCEYNGEEEIAPLTIRNCSIVENSANQNGGGFYSALFTDDLDPLLSIDNSILWGNLPDSFKADSKQPILTYCDIDMEIDGEGNIKKDPQFTTGLLGNYYLVKQDPSSETQGESPCIDAGGVYSQNACPSSEAAGVCLSEMTTSIDFSLDEELVDLGYHYFPSPEIQETGVFLVMPSKMYSPGETFYMTAYVNNVTDRGLSGYPLFIILDVMDEYWFGMSWKSMDDGIDYILADYPLGISIFPIFEPFIWPEGEPGMQGVRFWAALTDPFITEVVGFGSMVEFGWDDMQD